MPACPPTPASIVNRVDIPYPEAARADHLEGTALVRVQLDANAKITKVTIQKSAGAGVLDQAATKGARDSTFKAATVDCKPTESIFIMVVDLKP